MDLQINDDGMKAIVAKAIVDAMTPEARQNLLASAVAQAINVQTGSYDKKSALQRAFDGAVDNECRKYAMEALEKDGEFKKQIESLFADVAKKLFEQNTRDDLVSGLAQTIARALTKDRY